MGFLIAFYVIWLAYTMISSRYIVKQIRFFKKDNQPMDESTLEATFVFVVRNLFLLTAATLLVCSLLLFSVRTNELTSPLIGIALASGTFIFYSLFLTWDIAKHKVNVYFLKKYGVNLKKEVLLSRFVIATISVYAILLLEFVLSIITLIVTI